MCSLSTGWPKAPCTLLQFYWCMRGHGITPCYKTDMLIALKTAPRCLFVCWAIRIGQWLQDLYWQLRWMLVWRLLRRLLLPACSRQLTHRFFYPSTLPDREKARVWQGWMAINCLNPDICHPDRFLHRTTRSSCQVSFSGPFCIYFFYGEGTKM